MRSLLFLDVMQRWVVVIYQHYVTIPEQWGRVQCGRSLKSGIIDLNAHQWLNKNRSHMHLYNLQFGAWQWKDSTGPKFVNLDVHNFDLLWSPYWHQCVLVLHNQLVQLVMKHQDKTMWLARLLAPLSCYGIDHWAQSVIEVSCFHILLNDMLLINLLIYFLLPGSVYIY